MEKNKYIDICGIDSAKEEIDKLKNINKNKNIEYYNYFIEPKPENIKYKKYIYPGKSLNFSDTGAWRFQKYGIENKDQKIFGDKIYHFFHNTDEKLKNVKKITIDDFCKEQNFNTVNFLKIDTDGHSLKVLNSGSNLLNNKSLLGIKVEVSFSNKDVDDFYLDICHLLTKHNFQLLRIMPRRYEPYYLPDKFIYNFAAQNLGGFDDQGDIIFTRNLDSETINSLDYETFLKFLILLETFEMSGLAIKLIKLSEHKHLDEEVSEKFINILTKHIKKNYRSRT